MRIEEKDTTAAQRAEEAAIRQLVKDADDYQTDTDRFTPLLTEDVVIVNFAGRRVLGRRDLANAMAKALETRLARVMTKAEVLDIRFLRPDVAVVSCLKRISDENPDAAGDLSAEGSMTYVVVKESDSWRIALAQTTPLIV